MNDFFAYSAYLGCTCWAISGIGGLVSKLGWLPQDKADVFEKIWLTFLAFGLPFVVVGMIGFLCFIAKTWWTVVFK